MTNNDILRRIRFTFDYEDSKMIDIFSLVGHQVSRSQVCDWLKKDDEPSFLELTDFELSNFLNGFIIEKRGKKEGAEPIPEKNLSNNSILRKIKIALNLKDVDMLEIFKLAKMKISKPELSAFFRKPSQDQYRLCNDQYLRNFLQGLQLKYKK